LFKFYFRITNFITFFIRAEEELSKKLIEEMLKKDELE